MSANRGRIAAARTLLAVEEGQHAEEVLALHAPARGSDRSLAWFLALGVLRHRARVDAALRPCLRQPLSSLDADVRAVLRVGAFEILFARTPIHAAVHESVEVARSVGAARATGLVNAVLRKVREPVGLGRADGLDHPPWLVARWDERYGADATTAWCQRNNEPAVVFAVEREPGLEAAWREAGLEVEAASLHGAPLAGVWRLPKVGAVTELPGFAEGRFWVQDAASVAVADLVPAGQGTRVLDACAAPGGKTFRVLSRGARVTAVDADARRLALLTESARRLRFDVTPVVHDWTKGPLKGAGTFDTVLVDAPCTALGLVRRHPEIRWRRQLLDVRAMPATQRAVLAAAATHVKPGGTLVYAVCSPEPEEGQQVIDAFVADGAFTVQRTLSTAPPEGDEDAFFAAVLARTA